VFILLYAVLLALPFYTILILDSHNQMQKTVKTTKLIQFWIGRHIRYACNYI